MAVKRGTKGQNLKSSMVSVFVIQAIKQVQGELEERKKRNS
jgi:hypothetical protein